MYKLQYDPEIAKSGTLFSLFGLTIPNKWFYEARQRATAQTEH